MTPLRIDENFARELDESDPLCAFRDRFHLPTRKDGRPVLYFCGNSLGLQPKGVEEEVHRELEDWAELGVDGHFKGRTPWYSYHERCRDWSAEIVGGLPGEVVMMNSLTVNLHLMMVSFYRPLKGREKILTESHPFPSDLFAVETHLRHHGLDPRQTRLTVPPRSGERTTRMEDLISVIEERGEEIALVLLDGVHYLTGQVPDMERITKTAQERGCRVGFQLAHAAGNIPMHLHDWGVDFAVWCTYKYLNSGPGAVAGCFVHQKHGSDPELPRFAGWWGANPDHRFQIEPEDLFRAQSGADGWQLSNPPILAMAPLTVSHSIFHEAGMERLRTKSKQLTSYFEFLIQNTCGDQYEIITPGEPSARGCQLSLVARKNPREFHERLEARNVVCDFRAPDVIRLAPVPLYNSFHEVWEVADILSQLESSTE